MTDWSQKKIPQITEDEEYKFQELGVIRFRGDTERGVHILLDNEMDIWFPKTQLRCMDDTLYASLWIMSEKGLGDYR